MVDSQQIEEEAKDLNFIEEPSQLDKYKAAAGVAEGKSRRTHPKYLVQIAFCATEGGKSLIQKFGMSKFYRVFRCHEAPHLPH